MADPRGFLTTPRAAPATRPVEERLADWREVYPERALLPVVGRQAGRA